MERGNEESESAACHTDFAHSHTPTLPSSHSPTLPSSLTVIDRADDLYRRRGEPDAVSESVAQLTNAGAAADRYEVQWRVARSLFFLGQCAQSSVEKAHFHSIAVEAGQRAVAQHNSRVEGHFWLGVNLALFAEASGGLRAALALLRARRELKKAADICESYHGAGPLRVLGRLEHHAPLLLGGSRRRSLGYFERALATAANSVTMIYAAELIAAIGDRQRASELLQKVTSFPVDPEWEFENLRDRQLAQAMLDKLQARP